MLVYRLSQERYMLELSGYGASLHGQRWNSKGTEVLYTAANRALANSEVAVHLPLGILPKNYFMVEIDIPKQVKIGTIKSEDLPKGWAAIPSMPDSQIVGDTLVRENKYAVLKVPSAVVRGEFNFILNPRHKDFSKIKVVHTEPFPFDPRLIARL